MTTWPYVGASQSIRDCITLGRIGHAIMLRQETYDQTLKGRMGGSLCMARPSWIACTNP